MGASGWDYYTPFDSDINKAFQQLRERVLENGEYYLAFTKEELLQFLAEELLRLEHIDPKEEWEEAAFEYQLEQYRELKSLPEPKTFEERLREVFAINRESGTHSILDIRGISSKPEYFMAAPLSEEELLTLFGTTKPTQEMIQAQRDMLEIFWECHKALYIIVYENESPKWLYFAGCTGD